MTHSTVQVKTKNMTFQDIKDRHKNIEVVDWMWAGTSDGQGQVHITQSYLLALIDGDMCYVIGLPVKDTFSGPANKFKGFIYSQVMKLGVPFRNLFKNLNVDLLEPSDLGEFDLQKELELFEYNEDR